MIAELPCVRIIDAPVRLPDGLVLPALVRGAGRAYRELRIPLWCDREFTPLWVANQLKFRERGFGVKFMNGAKILFQNLAGQPGAWTLTAHGAEQLAALLGTIRRPDPQPVQEVPPEFILPPLPEHLEKVLRPYQVTPARQLFRALIQGPKEWGYPGAFDGSDMGTGKSAMTLAAAAATGRKIIVLCPAAGRSGWEDMFDIFGIPPEGIYTYEALRGGNRPKVAKLKPNGEFEWEQEDDVILILDEAQALRHDETLNVRLCSAAIRQGIPIIVASATIAISPLEMWFLGRIVGLHKGGQDWDRFLAAHGCSRRTPKDAWKWNENNKHLETIHHQLFPRRGCRVKIDELEEGKPETEIRILTIKCAESQKIEEKWQETMRVLEAMERQGKNTKFARMQMHMKMCQMSEIALAPHVARRAQEDIANGFNVAIFCCFTESRLTIAKHLGTGAGFFGGQKPEQRKYFRDEFQANRIHALVSNMRSGGASVSLHDVHGGRPRTSYVFPNYNPVEFKQAFGRVARTFAKSKSYQWIPCVAGTISERQVKSVSAKLERLDVINNGAAQRSLF